MGAWLCAEVLYLSKDGHPPSDRDLWECGATQTMSDMVESCPVIKLDGGLKKLHTADDESVFWLSSYGT